MIDKSYNPYDIFNNEDVKKHLRVVLERITPKSLSVGDQIATSAFIYLIGVKISLAEGVVKLLEKGTNYRLQQFQREQIAYLENHPEDIRRELRINLVVSLLYLNNIFEIKAEKDKIRSAVKTIWMSIKKLSFREGIIKSMKELSEKHTNEKWMVLRSPIALLMNLYYLNKNVSLESVDSYLTDLISVGECTSDIYSLCTHQFKSYFLDGTIKNYLENQFDKLIVHSKTNKDIFPQLAEMMEKCIDLRNMQVEELKEREASDYEFYRSEIEQWSKDYPAKENSNNYQMVVNALQSYSKTLGQCLRLDTSLVEDLNLNHEQREKLCEEFYKKKNFLIDNIYMEKFITIAELVSFWNAFDNTEPLNMTP